MTTFVEITQEDIKEAIRRAALEPSPVGLPTEAADAAMGNYTRLALTCAHLYALRHPNTRVMHWHLLLGYTCLMVEYAFAYDADRELLFVFDNTSGTFYEETDLTPYRDDPIKYIREWYNRCPREALDGFSTADDLLRYIMASGCFILECEELTNVSWEYPFSCAAMQVIYTWLEEIAHEYPTRGALRHKSHAENVALLRQETAAGIDSAERHDERVYGTHDNV